MKDTEIASLEKLGFDKDVTMERFMQNEELFFRCLKKFPNDVNYRKLIDSLESEDVGGAFEAAHSLKGVTANLGLNNLFDELKPMVEVLRKDSLDVDKENIERFKRFYEEAIEVINTF